MALLESVSAATTALFPNGVLTYAVGGALIGLGASIVYLWTGIIAGASTFLETTLSYVSTSSHFQQPRFVTSRGWRLVFTLGIIAGAASYTVAAGDWGFTTAVHPWRLAVGGLLVGAGTRLGKGCTSGHGVCGVGSGSGTSIVSVVTFLAIAIGTAQLVQAVGVTP